MKNVKSNMTSEEDDHDEGEEKEDYSPSTTNTGRKKVNGNSVKCAVREVDRESRDIIRYMNKHEGCLSRMLACDK